MFEIGNVLSFSTFSSSKKKKTVSIGITAFNAPRISKYFVEIQPLPVDHCRSRGSRPPTGSLEPEGSTIALHNVERMTHLDKPGTSGDALSQCRKKDALTVGNLRPRNPVKRRKEREDEDNESVSSESTIIADDSDTGDLMDDNEDEFILVEHRRKRSTGVPVLLTPEDETCRLQQQNPLYLSSAISAAAYLQHTYKITDSSRVLPSGTPTLSCSTTLRQKE